MLISSKLATTPGHRIFAEQRDKKLPAGSLGTLASRGHYHHLLLQHHLLHRGVLHRLLQRLLHPRVAHLLLQHRLHVWIVQHLQALGANSFKVWSVVSPCWLRFAAPIPQNEPGEPICPLLRLECSSGALLHGLLHGFGLGSLALRLWTHLPEIIASRPILLASDCRKRHAAPTFHLPQSASACYAATQWLLPGAGKNSFRSSKSHVCAAWVQAFERTNKREQMPTCGFAAFTGSVTCGLALATTAVLMFRSDAPQLQHSNKDCYAKPRLAAQHAAMRGSKNSNQSFPLSTPTRDA